MLYRAILLSLITGLSLLSTPVTQTMSWDFWTHNNYRNTWRLGGAIAGAGFVYYLWQQANKAETPEERYVKALKTVDMLHTKYDAKIIAFEKGYNITGDDLTGKNEQFISAQTEWRIHLNEEALAHLGAFSGYWYPKHIKGDVQQLSAAKIELSKMRRELLQEKDKNLMLSKQVDELLADTSMLFLQLSFLHDCVEYNEQYLDFLVGERAMAKNYAHVTNISATHGNLKQIICNNSTATSHQYVKFIQALSKDLVNFTQKINQAADNFNNTKLFRRAQQLRNILSGIEKRIYVDKALHADLRIYQAELLTQMDQNIEKFRTAINKTQSEADRVRGLEVRLTVVITTYQIWANQRNADGNRQGNFISQWQLDKVRTISQEIDKIFAEIQAARDAIRSFERENNGMQARFDAIRNSVSEQLYLQNKIEQMIIDVVNDTQTIQNAEKNARQAADDLYRWARNNNLFLV